jgi:hypothetical protein
MNKELLGFTCGYRENSPNRIFYIEIEEKYSGKLIESEIQMLKNYHINGILPLDTKYSNYRANLCYEIRDKKPLKELLNNKNLSFKDYVDILLQILKVIDSSKKYFLSENNYVLDIEHIFATTDYRLSLIYIPINNQASNSSSLDKIKINIVPMLYAHVNNQEAVSAKYIFDDFISGRFSIPELIERLNKENEQLKGSCKKKGIRLSVNRVVQIVSLVLTILAWVAFIYFMKSDKKNIVLYGSMGVTVLALVLSGVMQWLLIKKNRIPAVRVETAVSHESGFVSREPEPKVNPIPVYSGGSHDTVALYNATSALSKCACLTDNSNGGTITLDRLPAIIGRGERIGSYLVSDSAISGKHARIEKDNGHYIITDIGSTNKTFINGKILTPHKGNQLNDGDIVRMGRTEFTFQE